MAMVMVMVLRPSCAVTIIVAHVFPFVRSLKEGTRAI
jgi:hypothetical protein